MPSCIALRLEDHIAHNVTAMSTDWWCCRVSMSVKSHCFAFGFVVLIRCCANSLSTSAHVHLAIVQLISECLHESSAPHSPQHVVSVIFLWERTSSVGSECFDRRHKNILILEGTGVFHKVFQEPSSTDMFEEPGRSSSQASLRWIVETNIL